MPPPQDVTVSVIVPFRNGQRHLGELLESLVRQVVTEQWELLAVDNGSTDRSRQIAEQFLHRLPLTIVDARARANPSYARNVGVLRSSGTKLMFVDADDTLERGYITAMSAALDAHPLVTSRVDSVTLNPDWVRAAHGPPWQADGIGVFYDFLPATGVNIGVRRGLYDTLGGFSEAFAPCEDLAFSWDAQHLARAELHFVPEAVYRYRYRDTLRQLFRQSVRWGRGSVLLYRHFREAGMPGRPLHVGVQEWRAILAAWPRASGRHAQAPLVVRLGYCVGRLRGSLRYRVMYI